MKQYIITMVLIENFNHGYSVEKTFTINITDISSVVDCVNNYIEYMGYNKDFDVEWSFEEKL